MYRRARVDKTGGLRTNMWQTGIKSQATDFGSPCNSILLKNVTFEHENLPFRIILAAHHATGIPRAGLEPRRLYNMVEFMVHTRATPFPAPKQASARALAPCSAQWPWARARHGDSAHRAGLRRGPAAPSLDPARKAIVVAVPSAPPPKIHAPMRAHGASHFGGGSRPPLWVARSLAFSPERETETALSPKRSSGLPVFKLT